MSEAEKKQIKGVCEEISEKNGWTTFLINTGSQYPTRLSTKIEALISAGRAAGDRESVWTFAQSQGGENPNKPGTFYQNRRLEKVEVGGALDPDPAQAASGAPSTSLAKSPDDRYSIERQTIVKAAMPVYSEFGDDDVFFAFLERLASFVASGQAATQAATQAAKPQGSGDPGQEFPPGDDIPF